MLRSVAVATGGGTVHAVVEDGRRRLVDERCNLDDSVGTLSTPPATVEAESLCGHCYPDGRFVLPESRLVSAIRRLGEASGPEAREAALRKAIARAVREVG